MIIPTINFIYDRRHTAGADKKGYAELRITHNSRQKFISTGISCYPAQWDKKNECVIKSLDSDQLNVIIPKMHQRM